MKDFKIFTLIFFVVVIISCAKPTPPGQLNESDFVLKKFYVDIPIAQASTQLREGFRYCGPESGGLIFVTHHGVPDFMPPKKDGSILCDIYAGQVGGGRSGWVLGRIEMKPRNEGTDVALRVQAYVANKDAILNSWEMFLHGRAKEVCP